MINKEEIIGGVSPLKKKRQSKRGGEYAGKATKTAKRRGGFAKSKGKRGAGGRNVGGYNVKTRFTRGAPWTPPSSGGTTYSEGTTLIPTKPPEIPKTPPTEEPKGGEGVEKRKIPGEQKTTGNRFYDACHTADGKRKPVGTVGVTTWTDENGQEQSKSFDCRWGGKGNGTHDYETEGTPGYEEQRTYLTDAKGEIITDSYSEWERIVNKNK